MSCVGRVLYAGRAANSRNSHACLGAERIPPGLQHSTKQGNETTEAVRKPVAPCQPGLGTWIVV